MPAAPHRMRRARERCAEMEVPKRSRRSVLGGSTGIKGRAASCLPSLDRELQALGRGEEVASRAVDAHGLGGERETGAARRQLADLGEGEPRPAVVVVAVQVVLPGKDGAVEVQVAVVVVVDAVALVVVRPGARQDRKRAEVIGAVVGQRDVVELERGRRDLLPIDTEERAAVSSTNRPSSPPCRPPWLTHRRFWSLPESPPSAAPTSQSPSRSTSAKSTFSVDELLKGEPLGIFESSTTNCAPGRAHMPRSRPAASGARLRSGPMVLSGSGTRAGSRG